MVATPTPAPTPTPDRVPPTIAGINTTNKTRTAVTFVWSTNEAANGQVQWARLGLPLTNVLAAPTLASSQAVRQGGLTPGAAYSYRIKAVDAAGNASYSATYSFVTPFF